MNQVAKSVGTSELPILNSGGSFQIIGNLDLTVKGHVDGTTGPSISQTSGSFLIYSGTTLTTEFGMLVTSGSLKTRFDGVGLKATIKGSLTVGTVGGTDPTPTVEFDHIAGAIQAGTLAVEGDVTWNRGTFKPVLTVPTSPVNGGLADSWSATGTFTIGAAASLVPICPNKNTATAGNFWSILTGLSGIVGDAPTLPDGWGDFSTIFVDGKGEAKTLQIKR
jgi:hypothetical protein